MYEKHENNVYNAVQGENLTYVGVSSDCALRKTHYILHDLLEGIVPLELALCIGTNDSTEVFHS